MLNYKEIATKTVTTLVTGLIIGGGTLAYNSISAKLDKFNKIMESHPNIMVEVQGLKVVKEEMEREYKRFKVLSNDKVNNLDIRVSDLEKHEVDRDKTLKYTKEWVDYWVNLR